MIKLYVYDLITGIFLYESVGSIDTSIYDLSNDKDFTLAKPPNYSQQWYWYDNKWQSEPKQN